MLAEIILKKKKVKVKCYDGKYIKKPKKTKSQKKSKWKRQKGVADCGCYF